MFLAQGNNMSLRWRIMELDMPGSIHGQKHV